jgi:hypothetical protein
LRFVRELRDRGDADLALDFLERMKKDATPELARELPLEIARTQIKAAPEVPDSSKRLQMYASAQEELEKYLAANKGTPAAYQVVLELADVEVLRGRTMLSRALLQDTPEGREAEGNKARTVLVKAGGRLKEALAVLDKQITMVPASDTATHKRLETEHLRVEMNIGLNLFDQAQTISKTTAKDKLLIERGELVDKARKELERVAGKDNNSPICWQAMAWVARCWDEYGDPKKARARLSEINSVDGSIAAEGQRLARYFRLLVIKESPEPGEKPNDIIIEAGRRWLQDYPRHLKTPEGYGMQFLLAKVLIEQAEDPRLAAEKTILLNEARRLLRNVESSDNDFSDQAKRLKIVLIGASGGFTRPVADLKTFDDCYVRAQYEIMQMGEDDKKLKGEELVKHKQKRIADVLTVLDHALQKTPEGKRPSLEGNTARVLYSFWALTAKRYQDSIRIGEEFARNDPRSSSAAMAAIYALQSYAMLLAQKQEDGASKEALKEDRDKMIALAEYMQERWPRELAGDVARYQIGATLLHEKDLDYPKILKYLEAVTPAFQAYGRAQWEAAMAALQAEKEKAPGDTPASFHKRAVAALQRIPEPAADSDPDTALIWFLARLRLTRELFSTKDYPAIQKSAEHLLTRLPATRLAADEKRNEANHNQIQYEAQELLLHAKAIQADAAEKAGEAAKDGAEKTKFYTQAASILDPIVAEFTANKVVPMRKNLQLGIAVLAIDLRSNLLLGKLDQARTALKALQDISSEGGAEAGQSAILTQLAGLIGQQVEELRKKNNVADLEKASKGFTALIDDVQKQMKPSLKLTAQLARCYSNMENHKKAAELLEKVEPPKDGSPDVGLHHGIRLMLVRELRMSKGPEALTKAETILDEIIGTKEKPGWGLRDVNALKERVLIWEEQGKYAPAAQLANALVRQLLPKVSDNAFKDHYLECYYHVSYCMIKHAATLEDMKKKDKLIHDAALQIVELEKKWGDSFGSDASHKRFEELLGSDPALKAQYDLLKGGAK